MELHAHRACSKCRSILPFTREHFCVRNGDHLKNYCKRCDARRQEEKRIGPRYREMLRSQGFCCAICGETNPSGRNLAVDHNHRTGMVRGLLCHHCNLALGHFFDNPELLRKAATYLENPPIQNVPFSDLR